MGFIYKITNNINNKIYIGKTNRDINVRFQEHIDSSNSINSPSYNYYLHRAFRKYGIENFSIDKIEEVSEELINERERYWIKYYDSYNNGYNLTLGGEGNLIYKDEDILKLWRQGLSQTEITEQLGITHGNLSKRLDALGISKQDRENRGKEKLISKNSDPVLQYTKEGVFIREWRSASFIEKETGMLRTNIKSVCNGKMKSAYGYIWKRKFEEGPQRMKAGG